MASGDSNQAFLSILSSLLWKDEVLQIGLFRLGGNINTHLFAVGHKIEELSIPDEKQAEFLKKTLHQDVLYELASLTDFNDKKCDLSWLKTSLLKLFGTKESKVSSLTNLLKIKQLPGQSLRDFLSTIRIEGQKLFYDKSASEKESLMVMGFVNGLSNSSFTKALTELKPTTLEEAYSLIKNEESKSVSHVLQINGINSVEKERCDCSSQIQLLLSRISRLEKQISALQPKQPQVPFNRQVKCFNCNSFGHIARMCKKRPVCRNCGTPGHISENCRKKRLQNLRNLSTDKDSCISEPSSEQILDEGHIVGESDNEPHEDTTIYSILKPSVQKSKKYPKPVNAWFQYINGNGNRPKMPLTKISSTKDSKSIAASHYTKISSSNSEPARNKPIVGGTIAGVKKNFLFDTGAETNVIDFGLVKELNKEGKNLVMYKQKTSLKCANGSPLSVLGYTVVPIQVGDLVKMVKFTVVEKIFPKVILGMRFMRKCNVTVNPSKSQISFNNEAGNLIVVPFVSSSQENY